MQDFTGVPCIVDLPRCARRWPTSAATRSGINPLAPAELVIDHSVIADHFGSKEALGLNSALEYDRNRERYEFLKWGQTAVRGLQGRPAGDRHRAPGQPRAARDRRLRPASGQAYPDTLVGTDSHTTMINGLGVLGWGVGGIEAEAAMLGQPVSMLIPRVVGFKLAGELPRGGDGDRPRAHHHRDAAQARRRRASSSSSTGRASPPSRSRTAPPSAT
jgi:aconitate hydratase